MKSFIKQFNASNDFILNKEFSGNGGVKSSQGFKPLFIYGAGFNLDISVNIEGAYKFDHLFIDKFTALEENEIFFMEILRKQKNVKFSLEKDILTEISLSKSNKNKKEFTQFLKEFDSAPNTFAVLENQLTVEHVLILINNKFLNYNNNSDFYIIKIHADLLKSKEESRYHHTLNGSINGLNGFIKMKHLNGNNGITPSSEIPDLNNHENSDPKPSNSNGFLKLNLTVDTEIVKLKSDQILLLKEEISEKLNKTIELEDHKKRLLEAFEKVKIKLKKIKIACSNDKKICMLEQEKLTNKMKNLINCYEDQLGELQNQIAKKAVNENNKYTVDSIDQFEIIEKADSEENNIGGNFICVICLANKRNCCFIDCGHLLCCFDCSLNNDPNYSLKTLKMCINGYNVSNGAMVCPLCKRLNKKYRKVFF